MATLEELRKTVEELLARNTRLENELQARTTRADAAQPQTAQDNHRGCGSLRLRPPTSVAASASRTRIGCRPAPASAKLDGTGGSSLDASRPVGVLAARGQHAPQRQQTGRQAAWLAQPATQQQSLQRYPADVTARTKRLLLARLPRDAVAPTLAERLRSHMAGLRAHAPTRHGTGKIFVHADLQRCTHVMLRTDAVRPPLRPPYSGPHRVIARGDKTLVLGCNGKLLTVSVDRVKPAYVLPAPSATHFFDPAEDLFTDDTPSASGQTEPARGAAGDTQLQPAVIAPPRAPPTTTPRQLVRPPGPRPPQAHRSPPPQPPADYVTRAGRRVRFKRPCCVASAPRHRNRQSRARAAERRQNSAPTSRRPLRAFVTAPGPAFASFASAASGVEAGSAPAPAYLIRFSVELRTSRTTPPGLSVVAPGPAFEFRRYRTRASAFETSPPMTCNARLHAHRYGQSQPVPAAAVTSRQREDTPTARSPVRRADVTGRRPSDADRPPPKLPHCHHAVHEL
ncbi:putative uncharacterized protein ENSP00000383309 [Schistocerca americana]|uniref:putative uncharacterized protein ENSP00000383309 n=1 Tax=Schistocerca americana TaxID=7009 RepID=UPI001F502862|nr:putative uncharacterized protein ENSP00000383309 [Schistocerca americana]